MKRFIVAALGLLLAGHVFAAEVSCEKLGEMAYNAAIARDKGTPQVEVARTLAKNYGDDRADMLTQVVFTHSAVGPDALQFATTTRCLHPTDDSKAAKSPEAPQVAVKAVPKQSAGEFDACMGKAAGVTAAMLDCIGADTKRQNALLNKNYQAAIKSLSPERREKLATAQRAWLAYRAAEASFTGGTGASVNAANEFRQLTAHRAEDLAGITVSN